MSRAVVGALCALFLVSCGVGRVFFGLTGASSTKSSDDESTDDGAETVTFPSTGGSSTPGMALGTGPNGGPAISPEAPGCGRGEVAPAARTPVHFMFVLDRSGSMNDDDKAQEQGRDTKWVSLRKALVALYDDMGNAAANGETATALGVNYFADPGTWDDEENVELPMQLLDRARADALITDIGSQTPSGLTPTESALTNGYDALQSFNPTGPLAGGKRALVFVSDGKPNPDPSSATAINDLVASKLPNVRTFSIGIGELETTGRYGYEAGFMSEIAHYGGTGKPGCDPSVDDDPSKFCHFQVTPSASQNITADLVAAFTDIRGQLRSCDFPLNIEQPDALEPRAVIVVAQKEGQQQRLIAQSADDGWTFDDDNAPTMIQLHGSECALVKSDPALEIFAILGCACGTENPPGGGGTERETEGGDMTGGGAWNIDWCTYPWSPMMPCVGEGCPPPPG